MFEVIFTVNTLYKLLYLLIYLLTNDESVDDDLKHERAWEVRYWVSE